MNAPVNERLALPPDLHRNGSGKGKFELTATRAKEVLGLRRLPSRLGVTDAAILLNVGEHDIPVLVRAGLLQPLGHPPPNAVKYFATLELMDLAGDRKWLSRMCDALYEYWAKKNAAAKAKFQDPSAARENGRRMTE
ncbi:MAG: hypothetical protein ACR2OZ_17045 [Verrucomicrobiales bacterium]